MTIYYLRADNGAIKIGYSKAPKGRLAELSTASPLDLELVAHEDGGMDVEKARHRQYAAQNIRGEWFRPCADLNRHISKLNPDYVPMPYLDRSEYDRANRKLNTLGSWFSVNQDDPPKIAYVTTAACLMAIGILSLLFEYGGELTVERIYLIVFFMSPVFFLLVVGYALVKVWQFKCIWRMVRAKD